MISYILQNENAVRYECSFSCDNVILLRIDKRTAFFITDPRYVEEAKREVKNALVVQGDRNLIEKAKEIIKKIKIQKIIFDPQEWSVDSFEKLRKNLLIHFIAQNNFSQKKRMVKTKEEIKIIRKAVDLGAKAFQEFATFVSKKGIGLSEKELFFHAQSILQTKGETGLSFSPIIAINENAAKPHALASNKILKAEDLILMDGGVLYKGYCSDRTRVAQVGKNMNFKKEQKFKDKKRQKIYDLVLRAQEKAIQKAKPGMKAREIDEIARNVIEKGGFGKYFIHSTGHGVGLDIHELPVIASISETILKPGMAFTVEPGIYLPNEFGVRIEDMVLVTQDGVEVL